MDLNEFLLKKVAKISPKYVKIQISKALTEKKQDSRNSVLKSQKMFARVEMRRQSYCPSSGNGSGEPLIVVEESTLGEEEAERCRTESPPRCVDPDSPSLNPYLLSPWRDARKHSLPTPQCTSGITASQVRAHAPEILRGRRYRYLL